MKLVITLSQNELRLEIRQNGRVIDPALEGGEYLKCDRKPASFKGGVDSETALYYHDLSDVLISSLDKLLKRNNIDTIALNSFKIQGNTSKNNTSRKIAVAFIGGLKTGD